MLEIIFWIGLMILILIGVPIAFSMGLVSLGVILFSSNTTNIVIAQKAVNGLDSFTLLAIPFFMIAAAIMSETGVGQKIFDFAGSLVGHIRGGLAHVNILASVIMAGMSGSAVSDIAGIGKLEMEAMEKAGFDRPFSAAVTAASATIGPIIPPSIPMVLYGSIGAVSIGRLLIGGFFPGILMAVCMMAIVYILSVKRGYSCEKRATAKERWVHFVKAIPAFVMPTILLGGMLKGFMTPTESACVAVLYTMFLGFFFYRNLTISKLIDILENCGVICSATMFVISTAAIFGLVLTTAQVPQRLTAFLIGLSNNTNVILFYVNVLLLILGCLMETTAIFIILTPILSALAIKLGVDPVHFGVMVVFNLTMALLTPPVGMVMFLTAKVAKVSTGSLIKELLPFLGCLIFALVLITYIPAISTFLPNLLMGR